MSKLLNRDNKRALLYQRAEELWSNGDLASAFGLFLKAAKAGYVPAYSLLASFYGFGWGTRVDQDKALYWYLRSYRSYPHWHRRSGSTEANNIGCIWRDRNRPKKAIEWFERAAALGDGDANLNIAKIYLRSERHRREAIHYLRKTIRAPYVTDGSIEEARKLLKDLLKGRRSVQKISRRRIQGRLGLRSSMPRLKVGSEVLIRQDRDA